ncbi:Glutaredoxin domain-containing protein [Psidium guajava]|nr:Glutaredoxin domain-containing protein [Psidium guajava]
MQLATLELEPYERRVVPSSSDPSKQTPPSRAEQRLPADRARGVELQPRIHALEVEIVLALRQQPQHVAIPVVRQADRAAGLARFPTPALRARVEELRVAEDRGLAEPGADLVGGPRGILVVVGVGGEGGAVVRVGSDAAAPASEGVGDDRDEEDQ